MYIIASRMAEHFYTKWNYMDFFAESRSLDGLWVEFRSTDTEHWGDLWSNETVDSRKRTVFLMVILSISLPIIYIIFIEYANKWQIKIYFSSQKVKVKYLINLTYILKDLSRIRLLSYTQVSFSLYKLKDESKSSHLCIFIRTYLSLRDLYG